MIPRLLFLVVAAPLCLAQMNIAPLIELLRPESVSRMAQIATELTSLAANNVARNEQQVQEAAIKDQSPMSVNPRPSELLGNAVAKANMDSRSALLQAFSAFGTTTVPETSEPTTTTTAATTTTTQLYIETRPPSKLGKRRSPKVAVSPTAEVPAGEVAPTVASSQPHNPLLRIVNAFFGGNPHQPAEATSNAAKEIMSMGIRDFVPDAGNNFGIPKGQGCLPFLSEFMQVAYGNCQQVADEKAFDAWGDELKSAILTGQIDLLRASQETCRRGAEREQCHALRRAIADCDIMQSLQIGTQLQRAIKRCDDVSGIVDQNPMVVLSQIQNLIGGEFAQGFFNNFLGGKKQ